MAQEARVESHAMLRGSRLPDQAALAPLLQVVEVAPRGQPHIAASRNAPTDHIARPGRDFVLLLVGHAAIHSRRLPRLPRNNPMFFTARRLPKRTMASGGTRAMCWM
jgi:hypothetical protein